MTATVTAGVTERGRAILDKLASFGEPIAPGRLASACGFKSTSAMRFHLRPLLQSKRVVETGKSTSLRLSLPGVVKTTSTAAAPHMTRPVALPSVEREGKEVVWDGSKGSPSLTGDMSGLGSSLSGVSYEVGRRGR
jgi:hypothetical protein